MINSANSLPLQRDDQTRRSSLPNSHPSIENHQSLHVRRHSQSPTARLTTRPTDSQLNQQKTSVSAQETFRSPNNSDINLANICSICMESTANKSATVTLKSCSHVFHAQCILNWIMKSAKNVMLANERISLKGDCPNCRGDVDFLDSDQLEHFKKSAENYLMLTISVRNALPFIRNLLKSAAAHYQINMQDDPKTKAEILRSTFITPDFWKNQPRLLAYINFMRSAKCCVCVIVHEYTKHIEAKNVGATWKSIFSNSFAQLGHLRKIHKILDQALPYDIIENDKENPSASVVIDNSGRLPVSMEQIAQLDAPLQKLLNKLDIACMFSA